MVDLKKKITSEFKIGKTIFPNPIFLASGTCGFGEDISKYVNLNKLGGIILKGTTLKPKKGNPPQRIVETASGILNSIGLENPGIDKVITEKLPFLKKYKCPYIFNISGDTIDDYVELTKKINEKTQAQAIELNISCPNVKKGGMAFGTDPATVEELLSKVKKVTKIPIIPKLSPNVTNIALIAKSAENGGADALSLINTLMGMAFDIKTQKSVISNGIAGLSGPAIKPIAIRMVYQVRQVTKLPLIGLGGISSIDDIFEFFIAGANAVQIGTLNLTNPQKVNEILNLINN